MKLTVRTRKYANSQKETGIPTIPFQVLLLMAEIRRSPVEVGSLSHYLQMVLYIPGGNSINQNETAIFRKWILLD